LCWALEKAGSSHDEKTLLRLSTGIFASELLMHSWKQNACQIPVSCTKKFAEKGADLTVHVNRGVKKPKIRC
jgi:hypothetical protein